jgi:hypothetical protein
MKVLRRGEDFPAGRDGRAGIFVFGREKETPLRAVWQMERRIR